MYLRNADQIDSATTAQETFLANDDLGVSTIMLNIITLLLLLKNSVDDVQALIRKHEEFEYTCHPHDEKINQLSDQANRLIQGGHYDIPKYYNPLTVHVSHCLLIELLNDVMLFSIKGRK